MEKPYIITVHGIGGSCYPHNLLLKKLKLYGYDGSAFSYLSCSTLSTVASKLDEYIEKKVLDNEKVILIGHSAGGRIVLLSKNPKVMGIITIASPIQGSYLAKVFSFMKFYIGDMLSELSEPHSVDIVIPLATITTSFILDFDGKIWTEEMRHKDSCYEKHIDNSYHSGAQIVDRRMIETIRDAIYYLECLTLSSS